MKREQLEKYASNVEMELDNISWMYIKTMEIIEPCSVLQSKCNFNLILLYRIAPEVVLHIKSIEFLANNVKMLKRKLSEKEMLHYDFLIKWYEPKNFKEFTELVKGTSDKFKINEYDKSGKNCSSRR
jgi:hypothetical protein